MYRGSGTLDESSIPAPPNGDTCSLKEILRSMKEMSEQIQKLHQQNTQFGTILNMIPTMNLTINTMSDTINKLNNTVKTKDKVIQELRTSVKKLEDDAAAVSKLSARKPIKKSEQPGPDTTQPSATSTSEAPAQSQVAIDKPTQQSSVHQSFSQAVAKPTSHSKVPRQSTLSNEKDEVSYDNTDDSGWTIVQKKKQPAKPRTDRTIVRGTGTSDTQIKAVERTIHIQAWRFAPDTTEEALKNYLGKIHPSDKYFVSRRVIKTDRHASFIIGIPESIYPVFNSPSAWPEGVMFAEWFLRRPRADQQPRGSDSGRQDSGVRTSAGEKQI
ncbi:hypothetical protein JYU34_001863 [Plutella xylostella]|uniref:Uncharacterized protein n=1 Tax=Plutella xylostella TaxID=51655 RepID=A0ABQ7R521_PLUXY|nr:hypothetical protein JYU34_001863 [Plutella xylostella]